MSTILTLKVKRLISKQMKRGRYKTQTDVLLDALELLDIRNDDFDYELSPMDIGVRLGLVDSKAGRSREFDDAAVERIKRRGRMHLAELREMAKLGIEEASLNRVRSVKSETNRVRARSTAKARPSTNRK